MRIFSAFIFAGFTVLFFLTICIADSAISEEGGAYVGAAACGKCHEEQFNNYMRYSKKSKSFESIRKMKKGLTDSEVIQCYECHTTGYGESTGFKSESETPDLKNAGCEVCHGPGGRHAESGDATLIKSHLTIDDCIKCHNSERIDSFNIKPLVFGGAH